MRTFDLPGKRHVPDAMQFSPDGRHLAIQAFGRVDVLDTTTGAVRQICSGHYVKFGTAGLGFTDDSRGVVYFHSATHAVHSFDLETGQERVLRHSKKVPWCSDGDVEISSVQSEGRLLFVAVSPQERTIEIAALDPASGEQKFSFARHRSYLRELVSSPDGQWVAGCTRDDLRVWGIGGRKLPDRARWHVKDRTYGYFGNLALARNGIYLAVGSPGPIRVWNLQTGEELDLASSTRGGGVAFAADRPLLAFTQQKEDVGEVVFWDTKAQAELSRFDWGLGPIEAVTFSLDGCRCATASLSRAVVWDVDV